MITLFRNITSAIIGMIINVVLYCTRVIHFLWNIFKGNNHLTLIITNRSMCQEIFSKDIMHRADALGMGDFFGRWLGSCLGCLDSRDPKWAQIKKIFKPLFDIKPDMSINLDWEDNLTKLFNGSHHDYKPIPIEKIIGNLPLYFIFKILFGKIFTSNFKTDIDSLQSLSNELMCISFNHLYAKNRFYRYLPTYSNKKLSNFMIAWEKLLETAKKDSLVMTEGIYHRLLDNYIASGLKWQYFSQTMIEITFANQDVTIPSLAWLLVHYSLHPDINMVECDPQHFIEESARMSPIIKYSMPKITTKNIIIDGQMYTKGTTVIVDFEALGYNSDWKMDDLALFNPQRFNDIEKTDFVGRFGYGSRHCPGNKLTNILFQYVVNYLGQKWKLIPTSPNIIIGDIKKDPTKIFSNPIHLVHLLPGSLYNPTSIYYDCPPYAEIKEWAFMAISVNARSPILVDKSLTLKVIKYISERNQNKKVLILVCDDIAKYNIQAFEHCSPNKASTRATELGDKFIEIFTNAIRECGADNIITCRWTDIVSDDLSYLEEDENLNKRVTTIAQKFLQYRGQGIINTSYESKIELIKKYIFSEIGVLINGVYYNGIHFRVLYYCGTKDHLNKFAGDTGSLHHLILSIYNDPIFRNTYHKIRSHSTNGLEKIQGFIGIKL
jgi:cytochrome P450